MRPDGTIRPSAEVVRTRDGDPERLAPVVARAFDDDPLFVWIEPDATERQRFLRYFFESLARRSHLFSEAFVAVERSESAPLESPGELLGASLWKDPDLRDLSDEQMRVSGLDRLDEHLAPAARARFASGFGRVDPLLESLEPGRRWYLGVLAVAPEAQGRGLGGALMRPILERADRDGLPVTLETTKARNVEIYRRFGFETLASDRLPPDGPPFWILRRPPRGDRSLSAHRPA